MDKITIVRTISPTTVNKEYHSDGTKRAVANIMDGHGKTVEVKTAAAFVKVLEKVTEQQDYCIVPGVWKDVPEGKPFRIVSDHQFAQITGKSEVTGVVKHDDYYITARKQVAIDNSSWVLLDADNPTGMPEDWKKLTIRQRCKAMEPLLPGISTCERIELRASSERVENYGTGVKSHAWIRISDPFKLRTLQQYLRVETVAQGLSFNSPMYSRKGDQPDPIGHNHRTLFDLAVLDRGRLVFCARPTSHIGKVWGAEIEIVNEGGGVLDVSSIEVPNRDRLEYLNIIQDTNYVYSKSGNISVTEDSLLSSSTPIRDASMRETTFKEIVLDMLKYPAGPNGKRVRRIQAPFRPSESCAGVIFICEKGARIYDYGEVTTFLLRGDDPLLAYVRSKVS